MKNTAVNDDTIAQNKETVPVDTISDTLPSLEHIVSRPQPSSPSHSSAQSGTSHTTRSTSTAVQHGEKLS